MAPLPVEKATAADAPPATAIPSAACVLFSDFRHLPYAPPLSPSKTSNSIHNAGFYSTFLSGADRCFKEFATAVSEHPFVKAFLSLHSDLQNFSQMRCRSFGVACLPSSHSFAAILPGDSVAGLVVANGITNFLNIYNTLLVIRLVLTWFPNSPPAIVSPLSTLCDPYLNIFRGIIPPLGGTLDLSPILAFFVLNAFMSTASALPAELPENTASQHNNSNRRRPLNLTASQEKWMRRVCSRRSMNSEDAK